METNKLVKFAELIQKINKSISRQEFIDSFKAVYDFVKRIEDKNNQELDSIKDQFSVLSELIKDESNSEINQVKEQVNSLVNTHLASLLEDYEKQVSKIDAKLSEIKISEQEAKEVDEDHIIEEVTKQVVGAIVLPDDSGEAIVEKVNQLPDNDEFKIDAKHIKNLPEPTKGGGGAPKSLRWLNDITNAHDVTSGKVLQSNGDKTFTFVDAPGGAVDSVNGQTGIVVLDAADVGAATQSDIDTSIAALVDSAPATLDTLNELAAALGDDPNFATTIATSIGTKEPAISSGTTAQYWRGDKTFQTLNQAAVAGLTTTSSPTFAGMTLSGLTAGRLLYTGTSGVLSGSANLTFDGNSLLAQTSSASVVPFTIKGASSQSANYFEIKRSDNATLFSFDEDAIGGVLGIHANNGTLTGYYKINPNGAVSGLDLAGYSYLNFVNVASNSAPLGFRAFGSAGGLIDAFWLTYYSNYTFSGYTGAGNNGGEVIMNDLQSGLETFHCYQSNNSNMGVRFPNGKVIIGGTGVPDAKFHVISTTEQLRIGYDASNYFSATVGSSGGVTFDAVGSGARFTFSDRVNIPTHTPSSASDTGTAGDIAWDTNYMYVCTASNTWKRTAIATW